MTDLHQLTLLGLGVVTFMAVDYGYGRHSASLTRTEASDAIRVSRPTTHQTPENRAICLGENDHFSHPANRKTSNLNNSDSRQQMFYLYQIFYKLSLNLSKLSILTLYLRVFDTKDWFGYTTRVLIVIVTTYTTSIIMANIFICRPISTYWSTTATIPHQPSNNTQPIQTHTQPGTCINILAYWYASSLYNILSETLMLLSVLCRIWTSTLR